MRRIYQRAELEAGGGLQEGPGEPPAEVSVGRSMLCFFPFFVCVSVSVRVFTPLAFFLCVTEILADLFLCVSVFPFLTFSLFKRDTDRQKRSTGVSFLKK